MTQLSCVVVISQLFSFNRHMSSSSAAAAAVAAVAAVEVVEGVVMAQLSLIEV